MARLYESCKRPNVQTADQNLSLLSTIYLFTEALSNIPIRLHVDRVAVRFSKN